MGRRQQVHDEEQQHRRGVLAAMVVVLLLTGLGCDNLRDQARYSTEAPSDYWPDGASARAPVQGTVARGQLHLDEHLYQGRVNGKLAETFPFPIAAEDLKRGQERYNIYCAPCHALTGYGNGMVVQRGFTPPPSLHIQRLREAPVGHFYEVTTNGWGAMYSYNARVKVEDRWRIAAYIRALQLSQNAQVGMLSAEDMQRLQQAATAPSPQKQPREGPPEVAPLEPERP